LQRLKILKQSEEEEEEEEEEGERRFVEKTVFELWYIIAVDVYYIS
jgi:hypothetical protein